MNYKKLFVFTSIITLFGVAGCTTQFDKAKDGFNTAKDFTNSVKSLDVELSSNEDHTVIVPGYGAPVTGNATYEQYIDHVAQYVSDPENEVQALVFTGSYSSLENTSEAESMNSYFNSVVDLDAINAQGIRIYKEECAIVSWQNISNSQELLAADGIDPGTLTVFGDENRVDKLKAFATYKFNEGQDLPDSAGDLLDVSLSYTNVQFEGFDFGDSADSEEIRNAKFAAEIAAAYDTQLGNQILELRINQWTEEFGYDVADNLVNKGCSEFSGFR